MFFYLRLLGMLSLFKPSTGVSTSHNYSNASLPRSSLMPSTKAQTTSDLLVKNVAFQEQLDHMAAEMDRRNHNLFGAGALARELVDTVSSSWFSGLIQWVNGNTDLHEAVIRQDLNYVKTLKDDLNKPNRWGKLPIQIAIENGWANGVKELFKAGAQVPKCFAHLHLPNEILNCFLETELDVNTSSILLMSAVTSNQANFVKTFLHQGANMFQVIDGYLSSFDLALRTDPDSSLVDILIDHFITTHTNLKQKGAALLGPLPKDPFTTQFEKIVCQLIDGKNNISTILQMNSVGQLFYNIIINNTEYDMFKIITNMNWEHVRFVVRDLENFKRSYFYLSPEKLMADHFHSQNPETLELRAFDPHCPGGCQYPEKYADLNAFDKKIIFSYTDSSYIINAFLKGDLRDFNDKANRKAKTTDPIFWWIYSGFLANALNKIPSETTRHFACRGQSSADRLQRINSITFLSTSSLMSVCQDYADKNGEILVFDDIFGKDITALSVLPSQREYLNLPARIELQASALTPTFLLFAAGLKKRDNPQLSFDSETHKRARHIKKSSGPTQQ